MQEQSRKVTLPGSIYQQAGRWWWQVKLPGEETVKTRPLEALGSGTAACDPELAERIAVQMWEQAVVREGTRRVILDCAQKVEQFKAHLLDKLARLTEIVQSATARAQAEAHARTEIESRLHAIIQAAGLGPRDVGQRIPAPTDATRRPQTGVPCPVSAENGMVQSETGFCECCGMMGDAVTDFKQIDSGQWLCPDCLHTLRIDALQAELDALTGSLA